MLNIISKVGRRRAVCKCSQCGNEYTIKDKYSAKKSSIGDLCRECKDAFINLSMTQEHLQKLLDYNPDTGELKHRLNSSSGKKGYKIGTSHSGGYLECSLGNQSYLVHRLIWTYMTDEIPIQVDHKNHIRTDNRWVNLRNVDNTENSKNTKVGKNSFTGCIGVGVHKPTGKYRAYINLNRKQIHLGLFDTIDEAKQARKEANIKYSYHPNHGK